MPNRWAKRPAEQATESRAPQFLAKPQDKAAVSEQQRPWTGAPQEEGVLPPSLAHRAGSPWSRGAGALGWFRGESCCARGGPELATENKATRPRRRLRL